MVWTLDGKMLYTYPLVIEEKPFNQLARSGDLGFL
jgi:hypothetical protein